MKTRLLAGLSVLILVAMIIALPVYLRHREHVRQVKETVLQTNLWTMRRAIEFYRQDKGQPLPSLRELVEAGYLRDIPADPMTGSNQTWIVDLAKDSDQPNEPPGVKDVRSGAPGANTNGKPYNQY
jgi:general secretion pathway protein G